MAIWIASLGALLYQAWRGDVPTAGLSICYWFNLASAHFVTEIFVFFCQSSSPYRKDSEYGFPLSAYSIIGFMIGNQLFAPYCYRQFFSRSNPVPTTSCTSLRGTAPMAFSAIVFGLFFFLIGSLFKFPSLNAVLFNGNMLAIGGFSWFWCFFYEKGRLRAACLVLACSLSVPVLILTAQGFLSYGVLALLLLLSVVIANFRTPIFILLLAGPIVYLALSVGVTYLNTKSEIRRSVWGQQSTIVDRVDTIQFSFRDRWLWFDIANDRQRVLLDARFNQNYFVGLASRRIDNGTMDFVYGETIYDAVLAMIPRIIWPDKPKHAGGSSNMGKFTGLTFSDGTTFGIGHILEAYVNFGLSGLLVIFAGLGAILGIIDSRAGSYLKHGHLGHFLIWFVPGSALLNGGFGSFPELTAGAAGAFGLVWTFVRFFPKPCRVVGSDPFLPSPRVE